MQARVVYFHDTIEYKLAALAANSFEVRLQGLINLSVRVGNHYVFHVYWSDSTDHLRSLRFTLTIDQPFANIRSRFITADNMAKVHSEHTGQTVERSYCKLKVEQLFSPYPNVPDARILDMWFSSDGQVGELSHMMTGEQFSGTEVLRVYQYITKLLPIEKMFICDDAALAYQGEHTSVPVRLIAALATGKTWFEKQVPGLKLFDTPQIPIQSHHSIRQDHLKREKSLKELQQLSLISWYRMLNTHNQLKLLSLHKRFIAVKSKWLTGRTNKNKSDVERKFGDTNLQTLVAAVNLDAKTQHKTTEELYTLFNLLCGNMMLEFGSIPLDKADSDYWVKSRVHQLLWGGYVWVLDHHNKIEQNRSGIIQGSLII